MYQIYQIFLVYLVVIDKENSIIIFIIHLNDYIFYT